MQFRYLWAPLLPVLCLAQTQDVATNQKILDELRSIRASLERLEKGQRALLALARIQADGSQLTALEAQRQRLAAEERDLEKEIAAATRTMAAPTPMMMNPDGTSQPAEPIDTGPLRARLNQASSSLKEVQRAREKLDQEIAWLKGRIAAAEKLIEDALR